MRQMSGLTALVDIEQSALLNILAPLLKSLIESREGE
jgi:hypothetical protein